MKWRTQAPGVPPGTAIHFEVAKRPKPRFNRSQMHLRTVPALGFQPQWSQTQGPAQTFVKSGQRPRILRKPRQTRETGPKSLISGQFRQFPGISALA